MTAAGPGPTEATGPELVDVASLAWWCDQATSWPLPGLGATNRRYHLLTSLAQQDLALGRLVEAHADAVAISAELRFPPIGARQRWGVWAAGPPESLRGLEVDDRWRIHGSKQWCSGASLLTHALVDASTDVGQQLFAVELADPEIMICPPSWVGAGMYRCDTRTVAFDDAAAVLVGSPGEYLSRPGFWAGAVGVAACWHGGVLAVAQALLDRARTSADPHLLAHLGAVHVAIGENQSVIERAGLEFDRHPGSDHAAMARSARSTVERNAIEVIDRVGRALGPAPLAHDGAHAAFVADLAVYVRQHHAERDLEQIGRTVAKAADPWRV